MARKLCFVSTAPLMIKAFLLPHIMRLKHEYDITVLCNFAAGESIAIDGVRLQNIPLRRTIQPFADLRCLWILWRHFRKERYDAVISTAPKGGLLAMTGAWLAGVPVRSHWFTGQVWATRRGWFRQLLMWMDRLIAASTTSSLVDSFSQRSFLRSNAVLGPDQGTVLAGGSICGVDSERFRPNPECRCRIRQELSIPESSTVAIFVGRMTREKGVIDLLDAFRQVATDEPDLYLLLVGPDEAQLISTLETSGGMDRCNIRFVGYKADPEKYLAAADFLCLPSYREGFGNSVIEAAACGLPTIASRIYGLSDAVVDGETGWLHPAGDVSQISQLIKFCVDNPDERLTYGKRARLRAVTSFDQAVIVDAFAQFIRTAIDQNIFDATDKAAVEKFSRAA